MLLKRDIQMCAIGPDNHYIELRFNMKTLKICLVILCLLHVRAVGSPWSNGATFFMKELPTSKGLFALVDDQDYDVLIKYKWYASLSNNKIYIRTNVGRTKLYLHRVLLGLIDPEICADHIDGNPLNNQRSNLRPCNQKQNKQNRPACKNSKSKYLGVCPAVKEGKWRAYIRPDEEQKTKTFASEIEAALWYNEMAKFYFGEFARLNVIENG